MLCGWPSCCPPEDCGGLRDAQSLAGIIDDPSYFNVDETTAAINEALATPEGYAPASLLSEKENEEQDLLLRFPQFKEFVDACYYTPEMLSRTFTAGCGWLNRMSTGMSLGSLVRKKKYTRHSEPCCVCLTVLVLEFG